MAFGEHTLNRPSLLVRYLQCPTGKNDKDNVGISNLTHDFRVVSGPLET